MRLIFTLNNNLGRVYYLILDLNLSINTNMLFYLIRQAVNIIITGLLYYNWLNRICTAVKNASELRLKPLLPIIKEKVLRE